VVFTPGTEQCCGSSKYTVATQFCYSSSNKIGNFCGINPQKSYNPDLYECKPSSNGIYLKTGITDSRDSKTYDAVLIGNQTWMAKNLNYKTTDGNSRCYPTSGDTNPNDNDNTNCTTYGRFYNWATAMALASSYNSTSFTAPANYSGICPSGWHLPSGTEWSTLLNFIGGSSKAAPKLKSTSDWDDYNGSSGNGTDDYGFAALGAGRNFTGTFYGFRQMTNWWGSSQDGASKAYDIEMDHHYTAGFPGYVSKTYMGLVRCVKD